MQIYLVVWYVDCRKQIPFKILCLKVRHSKRDVTLRLLLFQILNFTVIFTFQTQIIPCLVALELQLPVPVQFCCIFAATKDKFGSFLKKLFHSSTSHTYHHNSSWTIRQARNYLWRQDINQFTLCQKESVNGRIEGLFGPQIPVEPLHEQKVCFVCTLQSSDRPMSQPTH